MSYRFFTRTVATWAMAVVPALISSSANISSDSGKDRDEVGCITHSEARPSHVRPLDPTLEKALADGLNRSASFRRLVERIEGLNGIVYLSAGALIRWGEPGEDLRRISGATSFEVVSAGEYRILKVKIELRSSNRTVATLAHELQHCVEILEAPEATNVPAVERLFARIGYLAGAGTYETAAAQDAGDRVFRELARCPASLPPLASEPIFRIVTR